MGLPDSTLIFPGHEITEGNIKFGRRVLPSSEKIQRRHDWVMKQRSTFSPTIPSTIGEEKETNVFCIATENVEKLRSSPLLSHMWSNIKSQDGNLSINVLESMRVLKDKG